MATLSSSAYPTKGRAGNGCGHRIRPRRPGSAVRHASFLTGLAFEATDVYNGPAPAVCPWTGWSAKTPSTVDDLGGIGRGATSSLHFASAQAATVAAHKTGRNHEQG